MHVVAQPKCTSVVIDIHAITCGALLVKDYGAENDSTFIVLDVIDADMWWQMKAITHKQKVRFVQGR